MRKMLAVTALAAAFALPLVVGSTEANASCQGRKNTGTLIGGVGGALLGNSISRGGGGAVIGGLGGAVVGHEIAKSGCGARRHAAYRGSRGHYAAAEPREGVRKTYYDQYGSRVTGPAPDYNR